MENDSQISLRSHLIRGASGSLILKVFNTFLTLLVAIILARILGAQGFGIYSFCLSVVQILTIPAMLGGPQLLVRELAAYESKREFSLIKGLLKRYKQSSLLSSMVLALSAALIGYLLYGNEFNRLWPFLIALILLPLSTALQLQSAVLRGLRHILIGQTVQTFRPIAVILIVAVLYWCSEGRLVPEYAIAAQVISSVLLVLVLWHVLSRVLPQPAKNSEPKFDTRGWISSALPFVFASGMQILNKETSIVILGALKGAEDVGFYRVAQRGAELVPFGLMAVNMAIGPTVSRLFAQGEIKRLQNLISKSIIAVVTFAVPVASGLILFGNWLIPLIFGQEFALAYIPLVILCLGQLVNATMGSVGLILNMVGLEKITAKGVAIAAIASVVLNSALIPFWGTVGAALATSISLIIWNVLLFVWLYKETGIVSTIRRVKV